MADVITEPRPGLSPARSAGIAAKMAAVAPLALRLPLGVVMAAHGAQKLAGLSGASGMFESMGFSPGVFWAVLVGLTELLGGAALLAGLFTRAAALALFGVQLVAMLLVHLQNGFFLNWSLEAGKGHGIEFNLVNLGALLALFVIGSGTAGVDAAIRHRKRDRVRDDHLRTTRTPRSPAEDVRTLS